MVKNKRFLIGFTENACGLSIPLGATITFFENDLNKMRGNIEKYQLYIPFM